MMPNGGQLERAKMLMRSFLEDDRGGIAANEAVGLVVALTVAGLVSAFLLPVAINEIVAVETSSWGSGASSIWDIMDLIIVLAAFLFMIGISISASERV